MDKQLINKLRIQNEAISNVARAAYERGYELGKQAGYKMKEKEVEEKLHEEIEQQYQQKETLEERAQRIKEETAYEERERIEQIRDEDMLGQIKRDEMEEAENEDERGIELNDWKEDQV